MNEVSIAWLNGLFAIFNFYYAAFPSTPNDPFFLPHLIIGLLNTYAFLHYIKKGVI